MLLDNILYHVANFTLAMLFIGLPIGFLWLVEYIFQ